MSRINYIQPISEHLRAGKECADRLGVNRGYGIQVEPVCHLNAVRGQGLCRNREGQRKLFVVACFPSGGVHWKLFAFTLDFALDRRVIGERNGA